MSEAPIFVVGTPRSGTTLLAAMLDAHSRLDCGPESRVFARYRHLDAAGRRSLLDPATWPTAAAAFVCDLDNQEHPVHELYGLTRDEVHAWLAPRPPSLAALLESLTAQRAARNGKARWVEKTPRHLTKLEIIRQTWPEAPIVRIVRDPRDVALSLARMPFASDSVVSGLLRTDRDDRASRAFLAADARSITLRYEDLVTDPEGQLRRLCDFIGEAYEPAMIERRSAGKGIAAEHEWWKSDVGEPLDPSRAGRWRREMAPEVQRFAGLHLARFLDEHGYEGSRQARRTLAIVPIADDIPVKHEGLLLDLAARDIVVLRPAPRTPDRLGRHPDLVFFGLSGQLDPDRTAPRRRRVVAISRLAVLLLRRRLRGRPAIWVRRRTARPRRAGDLGERAVALLLRLLARQASPEAVVRPVRLVRGDLR